MSSISVMKARFAGIWAKARFAVKSRQSLSFSLAISAIFLAFSPVEASAETRSLKLYYVHTGEKAEIAFKRNGRFLPDGLKKLNVFLRDWRRNEPTKMDPRLFDLVWQVYQSSGSSQYITVVSAYRSPATNAMLRGRTRGVAKKSQHMLGRAMDFFIPGVNLAKLRGIGMRYQIGGVGYYPRSGSPFVHMDVGNVRSWPRMSRRELLALFPDGKTAHLPDDGKPLPGYEQALAMIEKRKAGGGGVMMASNAPTRRSKSLFAALFGGGADEEEDNGDIPVRGTARPARATAPAREAPAALPEAPAPVQPEEPMIAALPVRNAPIPMQAPRPETSIGDVLPAVEPVAPAANETAMVAMNVPVPTRRPDLPAQEDPIAVMANQAEAEGTMQVAEAQVPSPLMNGFVPVPAMRPTDGVNGAQFASVIPTARPERSADVAPSGGQDAIAALVDGEENMVADSQSQVQAQAQSQSQSQPKPADQLALLSKSDEIGELISTPDDDDDYDAKPVSAIQPQQKPTTVQAAPVAVGKSTITGVRTTAKSGRRVSRNSARPEAVVQPVSVNNAGVALSAESVSRTVPASNPVLRNDAMRTAPAVVYTAGFQQGDLPSERANQFSGKAVTFMTVAKFARTN